MVADKPGAMAVRLRDGTDTTEETLRAVVTLLQDPTTQMVNAGWAAIEQLGHHKRNMPVPPALLYRRMIQIALDELLYGEQIADTDGAAKLRDTIDTHVPSAKVQF